MKSTKFLIILTLIFISTKVFALSVFEPNWVKLYQEAKQKDHFYVKNNPSNSRNDADIDIEKAKESYLKLLQQRSTLNFPNENNIKLINFDGRSLESSYFVDHDLIRTNGPNITSMLLFPGRHVLTLKFIKPNDNNRRLIDDYDKLQSKSITIDFMINDKKSYKFEFVIQERQNKGEIWIPAVVEAGTGNIISDLLGIDKKENWHLDSMINEQNIDLQTATDIKILENNVNNELLPLEGQILFYTKPEEMTPDQSNKAEAWIKDAQESSNADHQLFLGWMHEKGIMTNDNLEKAKSYYEKSASLGNSEAMVKLGKLMFSDNNSDFEAAFKYLKAASDEENINAYYMLGKMYEKGLNGEADFAKAYKYYNLAAKNGNEQAAQDLKKLVFNQHFKSKNKF